MSTVIPFDQVLRASREASALAGFYGYSRTTCEALRRKAVRRAMTSGEPGVVAAHRVVLAPHRRLTDLPPGAA